jgi:hypothetical protein
MSDATEVQADLSQLAAEIQARITNLSALFEENLEGEMDSLKLCLVENPSAAALLKDEDVGLLVAALRRTVSAAVMEAVATKAKPKAEKKKFTAEELQKVLDEEGF